MYLAKHLLQMFLYNIIYNVSIRKLFILYVHPI